MTRLAPLAPLALLALLASLLGGFCCTERDPTAGTLSQNVGASFAPCSEEEIKFLATKHNFMTAFRPCGNNNFQHFSWSPDGRQLYFQLVLTPYVMNAEAPNKAVTTVPTPTPIGPAVWLTSARLALPVAAAEEGGPIRLAVFDLEAPSVHFQGIRGVGGIVDLQRQGDPNHVLALVDTTDGARALLRIDLRDGSHEPAFPWLDPRGVTTFTFAHQVGAVVVGRGETVHVHTEEGEAIGSWAPALRGSLAPDGRWLALEHLGEPVSIFYQRSWDELSERARERELARAKKFIEKLPDNVPTEVRPPTLSLVDLASGDRWKISSVQGRHFQWYDAQPGYASFLLWGFEGKELKRNVLLGNLRDRMVHIERGEPMMGLERMGTTPGVHPLEPRPSEAPPPPHPPKQTAR